MAPSIPWSVLLFATAFSFRLHLIPSAVAQVDDTPFDRPSAPQQNNGYDDLGGENLLKLDQWLRGTTVLDDNLRCRAGVVPSRWSPATTKSAHLVLWMPQNNWTMCESTLSNITTNSISVFGAARKDLKNRPIRRIRRKVWDDCRKGDCGYGSSFPTLTTGSNNNNDIDWNALRGGGSGSPNEERSSSRDTVSTSRFNSYATNLEIKLRALSQKFGPDFDAAIQASQREHDDDCQASCKLFYCFNNETNSGQLPDEIGTKMHWNTSFRSYSMGSVPPEDFAEQFGFPLDLIKVSQDPPFFSVDEAKVVIEQAREEGLDQNEYESGKYRLGGNWLDHLPQTRAWFNRQLERTFFPIMANLFPEIISSPSVLRAHSVSLLKYNASHPRTDVHIDNGILALTVAMSPMNEYEGGGTFFEHMGVDHVIQMDVGHATFRPGSIRHGGHRVTSGTRYILGCFILLQDKVEHVRRLKNRGASYRRMGELDRACRHFEWALAINPRCTTCLKDWAEILQSQGKFEEAEGKLRESLELLENQDSDALFNLGVVLSEQGRDDEAIEVYRQSFALNAEDAELCYNLGIKLGAKGRTNEEMEFYERATEIDPRLGGAWLNWGTALAESGDLTDAEAKFTKALKCGDEVAAKAMMNLSILCHLRGERLAQEGELETALGLAKKASDFADESKLRLESLLGVSSSADIEQYLAKYRPHRMKCFRLVGQLHAGMGNVSKSEGEFRKATEVFPNDATAWLMLGRVLEVQGKTQEAAEVTQMAKRLNR